MLKADLAILRYAAHAALILAVLQGGIASATDASSATNAEAKVVTTAMPPHPNLDKAPPQAAARRFHRLGFAVSGGFPNGGEATFLYRPWKNVRFGGSVLYNYFGMGVGANVTVAPYYWIAPTFTLEAGHYFETNAASKLASFTTVNDNLKPWLEHVSYTYANAQVGLELGAPNTCVFFVRAGLTRMWVGEHVDATAYKRSSSAYLSYAADPSTTLGVPSAKIGLMFFFY